MIVLSALVGCGSGEKKVEADSASVLTFASAHMRLIAGADTIPLLAELAQNEDQQRLGLMERRQLADTAGMLFLYPCRPGCPRRGVGLSPPPPH